MTFAPTDLPGLRLWLKADALSLNDGDAVTSWTDSSGLGNHATEATNPPTYQTNEVNSLPVVRFDGTNDSLDVPTIDLTNRKAVTLYIVMKSASATQNTIVFENGINSSTTAGHFAVTTESDGRVASNLRGSAGSWQNKNDTIVGTSNFSIVTSRFQRTYPRDQAQIIVNGSVHSQNLVVSRNTFPAFFLNQASYIGARAGTGSFFSGDIAEILFYRRNHTPVQRLQVEAYLAAKYGITVTALTGIFASHSHSAYEGGPGTPTFNPIDYVHAWLAGNWEKRNTSIQGRVMDDPPVGPAGSWSDDAGYASHPYATSSYPSVTMQGSFSNDMFYNASVATCQGNAQRVAEEARSAGFKVIVETSLARYAAEPSQPASFEADRLTANTWIRANYASFSDALVDSGANANIGDLADTAGSFFSDGLHLSNLGYKLNATMIQAAMASLGHSFAFTPTDLTGLLWWFKADSYVGSDGDLVSTWSDSSGNAKHATAAGNARPTYKANIINSNPVMRFTTDDVLTIPATDMTATSTLTLYAVFSATAGSDYVIVENGPNSSTDNDGFGLFRLAGNTVYAIHRGTNNADFTSTETMSTTPRLVRTLYDKTLSTDEVTVWINDVTAGTRTSNLNNTGAFGNQTSFIGARNAGSIFLAGDIAEILLFNRALTFAEHTKVEHYLDRKYALLWSGAPA